MCSAQVSATHQPAGLIGPPHWRVMSARALPDYRLQLTFQDGSNGVVDLNALINAADAGVFASLRNPAVFAAVSVEHGAPFWPGDIDLAPDALYAAIKSNSPFPTPHSRLQNA